MSRLAPPIRRDAPLSFCRQNYIGYIPRANIQVDLTPPPSSHSEEVLRLPHPFYHIHTERTLLLAKATLDATFGMAFQLHIMVDGKRIGKNVQYAEKFVTILRTFFPATENDTTRHSATARPTRARMTTEAQKQPKSGGI